jgi:hypothetical protein
VERSAATPADTGFVMKNRQKEIEFFGKKYRYTSIQDYLSFHKERGISFIHKKLNLKFHMVKNCFSIGKYGQLLLPIENNESCQIIFEESFAYNHDDNERLSQLYQNFKEEQNGFIEIEEAVPLYHLWSNNFYHWTLECLPKAIALEEQGYSGKYIVFDSKFIVESLRLFGIAEERICYNDKNYIVKNLIIPQMYSGYDLVKNTALVEYLRGRLLDAVGILSDNNKVYIKRTTGRMVLNEDNVIETLNKYDFDIIIPENYSVRDQFRLMTNVNFSITAHGANATLILTQKKNSIFMEFFSSAYIMYHCSGIIKALNLDYVPIVENGNKPIVLDKDKTGQYCNITVPITIFEVLISNAMRRITNK